MFEWFSRLKRRWAGAAKAEKTVERQAEEHACGMAEFKALFENDDTFVAREFLCGRLNCCVAYINGMVDKSVIDRHIVEPMMAADPPEEGDAVRYLLERAISAGEAARQSDLEAMATAVIDGDAILFVEGAPGAVTFGAKNWKTRAITEPESEKVTKGPREGFNESLITNLSMVRRKLVTPDLKFKFRRIGRRSNTLACMCYLQELADPAVIDEFNRRLDAIDIDAVLSINYIDEMIRDSPLSIFITMGSTERPDVVAARLLEGRVALLLEGCPCGLTAPYLFVEYFQASEDYYGNFWMASISRVMRILGFVFTVSIPAIYLAMLTMHQEMVPTSLLLAINSARQNVPLPTMLELIVMLIVTEIMRESGARVPSFLGQSLSIVGGLVIGQAAVSAHLISAPIIIVIAFTAITSLIIPKMEGPAFILRVSLILITSVLGFYGLMIGLTAMFLHLLGIRSFGVHYMSGILPPHMQEFKDSAVRMPWPYMVRRPRHLSTKDEIRQSGRKT